MFESARKFIIESIKNYSDANLMFCILHAVTAVELLLKQRLYDVHPCLIYKTIDSKEIKNEKTVAFSHIPQRLENLGIIIDGSDKELILKFSNWRNEIVHHMPQYDKNEAREKIGSLYDFIARFIEKEFDKSIKDVLPRELYRAANLLMKEWQKVVSVARVEAQQEGSVLELDNYCPQCGLNQVVTGRGRGKAYCHCCKMELRYDKCGLCHKPALCLIDIFSDGSAYHDQCLNDYGADFYA